MKHILVVDDNKTNLAVAKYELSKEYQVTPVTSGFQALQFLEKRTSDLILLDINMPEMDGKETMRRIRERKEWARIPIIFLTADSSPETEAQCLADGADDFIAKPFVPKVMLSRVSRLIELNELRNGLEERLTEQTKQLELVTLNSIMAIANTLDAKDVYTSGHSIRVAKISVEIAKRLGVNDETVKILNFMALLHDIGKIGVPDVILNKPQPLTDEEFAVIKKHPAIGGDILKSITTIPNLYYGALYHHERFDGKGYPGGLKGNEIPFEARIIAVADAYDAMASNRAYRQALSDERIMEELVKSKGKQLDSEVVEKLISMLEEGFLLSNDGGAVWEK